MTAVASRAGVAPVATGRVLLVGAFGQGNPGDEALLTAFVRALPQHRPIAGSAAPRATAALHHLPAVARSDGRALARALQSADAVVVAGGTVFKTLHPSSGRRPLSLLRRAAALGAAARALGRPFALVGVGAGALEGPVAGALARSVVRAADLLVLRDGESADRLAAAGAPAPFRVGADVAWTVLGDPPAQRPPVTGPVVVALNHLAGDRNLVERLAGGLAPIAGLGLPLALLPWQADGSGGDGDADVALAQALAARLARPQVTVLDPPGSLEAATVQLAGARLVVALRFHALIAAAAAGAPALAVAHEPKLAGGARRLGQPAVAPDAPVAALAAASLAALGASPAPVEAVRRERERAEASLRLLRVLLARGRSEEADDLDGLALRPEEWLR